MMKNLFFIYAIFCFFAATAQEQLTPLSSNAALYYSTRPYQSTVQNQRGAWIEPNNYLIVADTIDLPFVDDFSTNKSRPFNFEQNNITATIINSFGACDSAMKVTTILGRFHKVQTYTYTYNLTTHSIDSTPNAPIPFKKYNNTDCNCFFAPASPITLYPEFFDRTFDTLTGAILTENLSTNPAYPDTFLEYAPLINIVQLPANSLWVDNYAYINNTMPILPPTIGVATFDGLNQYGLPYNKSQITNYGVADHLTSKPLDLSGLGAADSVYLSFFYQPQGIGDWPNAKDSLQVEFLNFQTSEWDVVWTTPGYATPVSPVPDFKQVFILVPYSFVPKYLYNGFQFRFKNYASLTGNNDHWHIDYVRLDKNRSVTDTSISDIAFSMPFPSILKNYEEITANEFDATELTDTANFIIVNNNYIQAVTNPPATNFAFQAEETAPVAVPLANGLSVFNAGRVTTKTINPSTAFSAVTLGDSIVIENKAYIAVSNINTVNDTVKKTLVCNNILAYDDGSAEWAYGIENLGTKKFAYEFNLKNSDTVFAYQVHYSNIDVNVSDLVVTFNLWKDSFSLNNPAYVDSPIYTSRLLKPYYIDSLNGYVTYKMDTPKAVSGKIFLGWSQTDTRNLQIGFDRNSKKGRKHMYVFTNGTWKKSTLSTEGSPMLRLVMGHYYGNTTAISNIEKNQQIDCYPNPVKNTIFIKTDIQAPMNYQLQAITGAVLQAGTVANQQIDISAIANGIYLLSLTDNNGQVLKVSKLIKINNE